MIRSSDLARRRLLAPEVIQTSAMDCGPAALTCLLEGFGIKADYARLQEACHLDLDGTSINTIEQIALTLGLDAEQVMLPIDHCAVELGRRPSGVGCGSPRAHDALSDRMATSWTARAGDGSRKGPALASR